MTPTVYSSASKSSQIDVTYILAHFCTYRHITSFCTSSCVVSRPLATGYDCHTRCLRCAYDAPPMMLQSWDIKYLNFICIWRKFNDSTIANIIRVIAIKMPIIIQLHEIFVALNGNYYIILYGRYNILKSIYIYVCIYLGDWAR